MQQMQINSFLRGLSVATHYRFSLLLPWCFLMIRGEKIRVSSLPIKSATPIAAKLVSHPNTN